MNENLNELENNEEFELDLLENKKEYVFNIEEANVGNRIDTFISTNLENHSRNNIQKNINDGNVLVNGKVVKSNYKLRLNDKIVFEIEEPVELEIVKTKMPLDIVYEDDYVIVINKEQGVVVHPAPGHYGDTLVNGLMYHCEGNLSGINGVMRPGIVHRIDKDTSGVIVVAKNDVAHNELAKQFFDHSITRKYYAIVCGNVKEDSGTIDKPIARAKQDRKKMAIDSEGRRAVTHYKVIERFSKYTLIEARLETGRTHQIRVHLASIQHPLLGDTVYNSSKITYKLDGQALHAKVLGFVHPKTKEYMEFETELPTYFKEVLRKL